MSHESSQQMWTSMTCPTLAAASRHLCMISSVLTSSVCPNEQWQVSEQEKERQFENDYERTQHVVLERMKQAGEQNRPDEKRRMEDLCKHMEELKLKEVADVHWEGTFVQQHVKLQIHQILSQTTELKVEQKALMIKQRQLQKIEKELKRMEEREKKPETQ